MNGDKHQNLAGSKVISLKSFWRNLPAKGIGLHVTISDISCALLAPAPPMPPSCFYEVASLNHLEFELPFTLGFLVVPGRMPARLRL